MPMSILKPEIKEWLNKSIESELYASNLYKHVANNLQRLGYFGAQKFFLHESSDELSHYQKIVDYMNDMGDIASVPMIPAISDVITSIGSALYLSYNTELKLLYQYQDFYREAEEMEDCVTAQFLLQFLEIQRTSVGEFGDFISRYERCGMNEGAILEFDEFLCDKVS
jgi:ferritin